MGKSIYSIYRIDVRNHKIFSQMPREKCFNKIPMFWKEFGMRRGITVSIGCCEYLCWH